MKPEITAEVGKATPPALITAASSVGNFTLNDWVAIATITYIAIQTIYLVYKWIREARNK